MPQVPEDGIRLRDRNGKTYLWSLDAVDGNGALVRWRVTDEARGLSWITVDSVVHVEQREERIANRESVRQDDPFPGEREPKLTRPLCPEDTLLLAKAWGIIANVSAGDWERQSHEWRLAAAAWRDEYHTRLGTHLDRDC
jgi:hypothetical protein